jgi:hypothetical protein
MGDIEVAKGRLHCGAAHLKNSFVRVERIVLGKGRLNHGFSHLHHPLHLAHHGPHAIQLLAFFQRQGIEAASGRNR